MLITFYTISNKIIVCKIELIFKENSNQWILKIMDIFVIYLLHFVSKLFNSEHKKVGN